MLKKTLLIVSALAVLGVSSPAVASAFWYMKGTPIAKNETLQMKGTFGFESEQGGSGVMS